MRKTRALIFTVLLIQLSCNKHDNKEYLDKLDDPELFQSAMQNLTDIIVYDIDSHACIIDGVRLHLGKRFLLHLLHFPFQHILKQKSL